MVSHFESAGIRDHDSSRRQVTFGGICLSMKNLVHNREPCKGRLFAARSGIVNGERCPRQDIC